MEVARRFRVRRRVEDVLRLVRILPVDAGQRELREPLRHGRIELRGATRG